MGVDDFADEDVVIAPFDDLDQLAFDARSRIVENRRTRGTRKLIDAWAPELSDAERKRIWAAMRAMFGSFAWRTMRHELGLTSEETSDTFAWMLELVMKDLERRSKHAQRKGERDD